jgi:LSU ribosomal protein L17P
LDLWSGRDLDMNQAKLGRTSAHRKAMLRSIVTSLFEHERIRTTEGKARQLEPVAEKLITLAKRGDLHARRLVAGYVRSDAVTKKLFDTIAPRYRDRQGGYVRTVKLGDVAATLHRRS